jgi:hypothetical protein
MFALVMFLALAPATDARVSLVVVHDASAPLTIDVARAAAKHLYASAPIAARISTAIQEVPLSATCARAAGCEQRPDADVLLLVTTSTTITGGAHLEILDERGVVTASEDIAVDATALVPAVLAPTLDRMIEKAKPLRRTSSSGDAGTSGAGASSSVSASEDGNSFLPWVLGGLGTCAGICALSTVTACIYGIAADGGGNNGGAGVNTDGCAIDLGIGDALGGACDGLGDGLGSGADACGSIGNIGSCAVPLAVSSSVAGPPIVDDGAPLNERGAMAY